MVCMETETVTPINDTVALLRSTSPEGLLDTYAALTHRLHGLRTALDSGVPSSSERVTLRSIQRDLRAQRDMVRGELLRRMGGDR